MLAGGLLAGGYIYRVLSPALSNGSAPVKAPPQKNREAIALVLASAAVLLGFTPSDFYAFLEIGREAVTAADQPDSHRVAQCSTKSAAILPRRSSAVMTS
jgi:hypothetical protein